ncbi:MAG: hypothetical protein Q7I93_01980 [Syntrophales bacterium]|nr:hypothetical protein [Syntrophales bacterium]
MKEVVIVSGARTAAAFPSATPWAPRVPGFTHSLAMPMQRQDLNLGPATLCIGGG